MIDRELDLCEMMRDPYEDAYEAEDFSQIDINDDNINDFGEFMPGQTLGMALGLAEMIAEENASIADPAELFEDFQESLEKISLKSRHKSKVPVPSFEQYVYNKCGIS